MGRNLPKRITDAESRCSRGGNRSRKVDHNLFRQGIGDQVLFMHNMLETIEELKNLFICEQRMPHNKAKFSKYIGRVRWSNV